MSIRSFQSSPWPSSGSSGLGALEYQGTWDCSTAAYPTGATKGQYWICSVAGTISGTTYAVHDWMVYNGTAWNIVNNQTPVLSVAGKTGTVTLVVGDISGAMASSGFTAAAIEALLGVSSTNVTALSYLTGTNTGDYNNIYNSTANGTTGSITPVVSSSTAGKPLTSTYEVTAAANALTINVPSGTPKAGDQLLLTFLDNGTARTITWTLTAGGYAANPGFALPTTTVISTLLMAKFLYRADGLWHCMAVA